MSSIASIVVNDALATPAAHTFAPARQGLVGPYGQLAEYEDRAVNSGVPIGFYKIVFEINRPQPQRRSYRFKLRIETPILEVVSNSTVTGISPAPTISYKPMVTVDFVIPERASLQSRKDLRKFLSGALVDAQIQNAIENLDFPI